MTDKELNKIFSSEELSLLDVIKASYLSVEDVKWLKSKRWFKRFLKIYARELKKRYKDKPIIKKEFKKPEKEEIEVLDFTQSINIPSKEVIEILDFTRTIDVTDAKDIVNATDAATKRVKFEKRFWSSIIVICVIVIIVLFCIFINWQHENNKTTKMIKKVQKVAFDNSDNKNNVTTTSGNKKQYVSDYYAFTNMNIENVDFNALKKINSDTVGWIQVAGTSVNYPFVKYSDNEFYLEHSFDKSKNKKGWVFLDYRNNINNLNNNIILYAHGLYNNTMFGSLRKVIKSSWYNNKNNHIVKVSTESKNYIWQVISTYTIEPESYYITTQFSNDSDYQKFIDTIKSRSVYNYNVDVGEKDKILTLSTCYNDDKRVVLHAKLISETVR